MDAPPSSALERPAAELTVVDVYDMAAALGQELERVVDRFGCEALVGVVPYVVRVLELLETLVSRRAGGEEAEELRGEVDRLRRERSERSEQERRHQEELEQVEDTWRGEVQDLLSQIAQLQVENKKLQMNLSVSQSPVADEHPREQQGMVEKERQVTKRLNDLVDKQRDEIRARDHELKQRNEDVEALQLQQHRLMRTNQDLRHRTAAMEAQGKALIQKRAELEAAAQARQQELRDLQLEVTRLRELEEEVAKTDQSFPSGAGGSLSTRTRAASNLKTKSVWAECGGDPGFLESCFEDHHSPSYRSASAKREHPEDTDDTPSLVSADVPAEDTDGAGADVPRFTLQELSDVLQERNELKARVFVLEEELGFYRREEGDDHCPVGPLSPSPPPPSSSSQPESGIRCLIFTAIMPMVAAGLIAEDPTLMPIRRLSFV